ncbi:MAG: hypothetical protein KKE02_06195, partial [Alphaproteobacteria bacterium]|nr:hypothetical protein [Alphaproteobacteria bacterium]
ALTATLAAALGRLGAATGLLTLGAFGPTIPVTVTRERGARRGRGHASRRRHHEDHALHVGSIIARLPELSLNAPLSGRRQVDVTPPHAIRPINLNRSVGFQRSGSRDRCGGMSQAGFLTIGQQRL